MKKALVLFPCDGSIRQRLEAIGQGRCEFVYREKDWDPEVYHNHLKTAHIILGEPKNEDFVHCQVLEWMQSPSSGVNYYVNGGAFPSGAMLSCATGCYGPVIAEHMLAMTLSLCRRLPEYRDQQRAHLWQLRKFDKQLSDCTLVILGAGDIGTTLAKWMKPMVKRVIGIRRRVRAVPDCFDEMGTLDQLEEYLPQADLLLCALPQTRETLGLLNEARLRSMKDDAVIVNGGRGSLIDQEALLRVMAEGKFWGVGLEVTTPEPLPADSKLWDQPRLILTPHAAGNSFAPDSDLVRRIWTLILANVERYLDGQEPENRIDFEMGYSAGR